MPASYLPVPSFLRIYICTLAFIPAFYTLPMIDDLSLISLLNFVASMFLKLTCLMYLHLSHGYTALLIKPN